MKRRARCSNENPGAAGATPGPVRRYQSARAPKKLQARDVFAAGALRRCETPPLATQQVGTRSWERSSTC